jgi:predicted nucleic-acid-binding protein
MVMEVTHKELKSLIETYYKNKIAFFCWGRFGIGKSRVVRDMAEQIAKQKKKELVVWNEITKEEKLNIYGTKIKNSFIFMDIRLSEFDASDIKGLPQLEQKLNDWLEWKMPFFAKVLEHSESDGILIFDEINLSTPLVMSSCYKIIYDRIINEGKISDNWLILGAGNVSEDRAYTSEVAPPLRDRGGEVELKIPSVEDWTDWSIKNKIDSRIIGFLNSKSSNLWKVNYEDNQKFTTPRAWERVSSLTKGVQDYSKLKLISSSAIGEGTALEFVAFCKIQEKLKVEEIIKNPKLLERKGLKVDEKYFVVTAVADKYRDKKAKFEKIIEITKVLDRMGDVEFVALMWRMCCAYNPTEFKKDFLAKLDDKIASKYSKYII